MTQNERIKKLESYLEEVQTAFPDAVRKGSVIIAPKTQEALAAAIDLDSIDLAFVPGNYAYAAKLDLSKAIGKETVAEPIKLVIAVQDHRVNGVGKFLKEAVLDPEFKKGVDSDPVFKNFAMPNWWNK